MPLLCFGSCFGRKKAIKSPKRRSPASFPGVDEVKKELFGDDAPTEAAASARTTRTTSTHHQDEAPPLPSRAALQTAASPLCEPCKTYRAHVPVEVSVMAPARAADDAISEAPSTPLSSEAPSSPLSDGSSHLGGSPGATPPQEAPVPPLSALNANLQLNGDRGTGNGGPRKVPGLNLNLGTAAFSAAPSAKVPGLNLAGASVTILDSSEGSPPRLRRTGR